MNIKQLRYFCEVVSAGNANIAAKNLFVAPTAISMQINLLEEELGGKLFDRASRPMRLTTLGEFFHPKAKSLLSNASQLLAEAQEIATGNLGWLSIGFTRSTIFSVLPEAVRLLKAKHPDIRVELIEVLSEHQVEALRKGTIHIGISRVLGDFRKEDDARYTQLLSDPMYAAISIDHPLAKKKYIQASDFDEIPFITYPKDPNSNFAKQTLRILEDAGAKPKIGYEAIEIHTALGLVAAGLGITLVGGTVTKNNRTDVKFLPVRDVSVKASIFTVQLDNSENYLVKEFLEILTKDVTV
jgi:DNA-binding transcriptional LysR family regulator